VDLGEVRFFRFNGAQKGMPILWPGCAARRHVLPTAMINP